VYVEEFIGFGEESNQEAISAGAVAVVRPIF